MSILKFEPLHTSDSSEPQPGSKAPDFEFTLTSGSSVSIKDLVSKGPVLLNFIKGTWCPFCQVHMGNLRKWQDLIPANKKTTLLVISSEDIKTIRQWVQQNGVDFLFGSVVDENVFASYGVDLKKYEFPRPATFLIDRDQTIRAVITGKRDQVVSLAEKAVEELDLKSSNSTDNIA